MTILCSFVGRANSFIVSPRRLVQHDATAWAERVLLGIYPLTDTAYSLRVQQRTHPTLQKLPGRCQTGFTYIGLLILIAIMGVTLAGIGTVWSSTRQRLKEQQLLFSGNQISNAITAYYQNTPAGTQPFPKKLEDLLLDKRYPNVTRYLRKIFADPFTGTTQWGLIKGADGGIVGVHSMSELTPIKTDNFPKGNESLVGKKHYSEWQFNYHPSAITPVASAAPAAVAPPVNPNPPAYQVAPPIVLPPAPTPEQSRQHLCDIMHNNDANTCAQMETKFDSTAGAACMASANLRYSICLSGSGAGLPPLNVQYK